MATTEGPLTYADRRALSVAPANSTRTVPFFAASASGGFVYPAHYETDDPMPRHRKQAQSVEFPGFTGTLRDEQRTALASIVESIEARGSALCEMRTGFGKTVVALALCAKLRVRALVLVHTHTLLEQWVERARDFLGVEALAVSGAPALARCLESDAPLVVAMIQTVVAAAPSGSKGPKGPTAPSPRPAAPNPRPAGPSAPSPSAPAAPCPQALALRFDLVVYDEVHHVCARAFSRAIFALRSPMAVGLSATIDRADGLGVALGWFFGPSIRTDGSTIRATVERFDLGDHGVEVVTAYNRALRREAVNFSRLVSDLAACEARTAQIAERVRALLAEGRTPLVVCSRVTHCHSMRDALSPYRVRLLAGGKGHDGEEFDAIVGTTGTVGEGFDEPRLDTLVFATPVVAVTQAIGRILRRRNAMPPLVLDPVDPIAVCSTQWFRRLQAYRNAGHRIRVGAHGPHGPHGKSGHGPDGPHGPEGHGPDGHEGHGPDDHEGSTSCYGDDAAVPMFAF